MSSDSHVGGVPLVGGNSRAASPEDTVNILAAAKSAASSAASVAADADFNTTDANLSSSASHDGNAAMDASHNTEKNPLIRFVTYQFAENEVKALVQQRLSQAARSTKINGFRPGKVPLNVMQSRVGERYLLDVLGEKTGQQFNADAAAFAESERPAAAPRMIRPPHSQNGQYQVECSYEVMPSVEAPTFDKQKLRRPQLNIGDNEIDEMVERLRNGKKEYHETPRAAEKQDMVRVDCIVRRGDAVVEDVKDRPWHLDSPMIVSEVLQALVGAAASEKRQVQYTVPETHPDADMRGATLQMEIVVNAVLAPHLPELNDEFFAGFGVKEGGLAAFRIMVGEHLQTEVKHRIAATMRNRVMDILLRATPVFPLPQTLLMQEVSSIMQRTEADLEARGLSKSLAKLTEESAPRVYGQAMRHVTLGLIINAWREREKVSVGDDEIAARLNDIARDYEDPDEFKQRARADERALHSLHLSLLEDKVADWVAGRVQVVDVPVTLSQLLDGHLEENAAVDSDVAANDAAAKTPA